MGPPARWCCADLSGCWCCSTGWTRSGTRRCGRRRWRCAVARWPRSAFVLTSRLTQWEGLQATPERDHFASQFLAVRVAPMDPGTQAEYVRTWWRETERARDRLRDAAVIAAAAEVRAAPLLEALRKAREGTPHRAQMFANPLMLSMLCALDAAGEPQPERPAALYEAVLRLLIENWQRPAGKKLPLDEARVVLEPLAYGSQAGAGRALRYEEAVAIVERPLADTRELRRVTPTAGDLLAVMRKDCGIFTGDDPGYVEFLHLQLREYLAAGHVQRQQLGHALAARLGTADEAHWKETMLLAMQMPGVSGPFLAAVLERGTLGPSRAVVRECVVEAGAQLDAGPITRAIDAALTQLARYRGPVKRRPAMPVHPRRG